MSRWSKCVWRVYSIKIHHLEGREAAHPAASLWPPVRTPVPTVHQQPWASPQASHPHSQHSPPTISPPLRAATSLLQHYRPSYTTRNTTLPPTTLPSLLQHYRPSCTTHNTTLPGPPSNTLGDTLPSTQELPSHVFESVV